MRNIFIIIYRRYLVSCHVYTTKENYEQIKQCTSSNRTQAKFQTFASAQPNVVVLTLLKRLKYVKPTIAPAKQAPRRQTDLNKMFRKLKTIRYGVNDTTVSVEQMNSKTVTNF
jgi:hypothetical protein